MLGRLPLRAAIITTVVGHGFANALFDGDQYGATPDLLARLDDPFLVQSAIALLAVAALSLHRRGKAPSDRRIGRFSTAAWLIAVQVVLFLAMECSERLAIDAIGGAEVAVEPFEVGFVAELIVALGSALILTLFGEAARRILGVRGAERLSSRQPAILAPILPGHAPATASLAVGAVRAPPRSPAPSRNV